MNISLIASLSKHNVYYVKDKYLSFYLSIPKNNNNVHITIEIKNKLDKFDFNKNDTLWVKENVLSYFKEIDAIGDSYIIPMFEDKMLNIMGDVDTNNYIHVEKLLSYIINSIFTILTNSKITPLKEIILIKSDQFLSFITYFNNKYGNRVEIKSLLELLQEHNIEYGNYKKIAVEDMNFVIGNNTEQLSIVVDDKLEDKYPEESPKLQNNTPLPATNGGYVSYFLLGAVAIVFAVFILYLLI